MTTPTPPVITPGDAWTLVPADGLGTGIGAIPAAAVVTVSEVLPPFSAGVGDSDQKTVTCSYHFQDWAYDASGNLVQVPNSRILSFPESDFRALFLIGGTP